MKIDAPKSKHVSPEGVLVSSSASAITTFDARAPFGCNRKWWFQFVAGLPVVEDESLKLGTAIHAQIEHYLKTGQDALGKEARAGKANIDKMRELFPLSQIENWIPSGFEIDGVKIRGKVDLTGVKDNVIQGIVDWKSSSDIQKWGKTPYQLRKDTQMVIYRAHAEREGCIDDLPMFHVYFGTKKRESEIVRTTINRTQLSEGLSDTINTLRAMKQAAKILDAREVPAVPDRSTGNGKCSRCPFLPSCPSNQGAVPVASLADRFKKQAAANVAAPAASIPDATPTAPQAPAAAAPSGSLLKKSKLVVQDEAPAVHIPVAHPSAPKFATPISVLPPDAPKSDPAKAALPVEGFSPVPAPKAEPTGVGDAVMHLAVPPAKRGRPAGSKNKPTTAGVDVPNKDGQVVISETDFAIFEVGLAFGATVKANPDPKNFEFLRVDYTLKASLRPGADESKVRAALAERVQAGLVNELERMTKGDS